MLYTTRTHTLYTNPQPTLTPHSFTQLTEQSFLTIVEEPNSTKYVEYLTVLDLGALIPSLCIISLLSNSGLSGCVLSCKMSISLLVVRLWYRVPCLPMTPPTLLINLSILLLSCFDTFSPQQLKPQVKTLEIMKTSGGPANWYPNNLSFLRQ